jgi:S-formylglutathione hydrolase FrmB
MTATSRRRFLAAGVLGGTAAAGATMFELVDHGELPGKSLLDQLDGACDVTHTERFRTAGPTTASSFYSRARNRQVAYRIAYPPGHGPGDRLPLVIALYGNGGNVDSTYGGLDLARALAGVAADGTPIPPMALVQADGGNDLYWNPHPGDNPLRMLSDELLPLCRSRGLGLEKVGVTGISAGGYGSLLLTETHPDVISACAAISPAIWTSYDQARSVNRTAYADAAAFADADVITHAARLEGIPVRIAIGNDDPFRAGTVALLPHLSRSAHVYFGPGCHSEPFFAQQQLPSLQFLGEHLVA